jgi:hypothetical protein
LKQATPHLFPDHFYFTRNLSWELPSLLPLGLSGGVKLARAAVLLTVKKTSVPLLLMISVSLLAVNYFDKPTCAGVSHCWRMSPHAILWASDRRIGAEQMFPTRLVQKPSSFSNLLPARPSFGYQDNLPVVYLPFMIVICISFDGIAPVQPKKRHIDALHVTFHGTVIGKQLVVWVTSQF